MKSKKANITLGALMASMGLVAFVFGLVLILNPGIKEADLVEIAQQEKLACSRTLNDIFGASTGTRMLTIRSMGLSDAESKLMRASLAISMCKGYELEGFCLGTACGIQGMELTLKPKLKK